VMYITVAGGEGGRKSVVLCCRGGGEMQGGSQPLRCSVQRLVVWGGVRQYAVLSQLQGWRQDAGREHATVLWVAVTVVV
jgi:hypothetical protein